MFWKKTFILCALVTALHVPPAAAQLQGSEASNASLTREEKMSLARQFVARMKSGLAKAEANLQTAGFAGNGDEARGLPDGEDLIFRIRLADRLKLDTPLLARVYGGRVALSLRDFVLALDFPIEYDPETGVAQGWYIRENKLFSLNAQARAVSTDHGTFQLSNDVHIEDDDLFVPVAELGQWFDFTMQMSVSHLDILLKSEERLPIQDRLMREKRGGVGEGLGEPVLPPMVEAPKLIDFPFIDVNTYSRYSKPGDANRETQNSHRASIQTKGDFLGGTLSTQSQINNEDKLTNLRATYKQESLEPELLGPLAARKYEIGDVISVNQQLDNFSSQGTGVRVSNIHPLRSYLRPTTEISGQAFPGWEVELYRDSQLVGYQRVGDDGIYRFENVNLYSSDNTFKAVLYGPQGEQREEEVYIPVDGRRLSEMGSAYDISIQRQNEVLYRKNAIDNDDDGAPNVSAVYEVPVSDFTALSAGLESGSRAGEQMFVGHAGVSTILSETLLNLSTAVENTGEMAAELVARRNIGQQELRNETRVATDKFGLSEEGGVRPIFEDVFSMTGPIDIDLGNARPRYNLSFNYGLDSDGNNTLFSSAGVSGSLSRISFNQQFDHTMSDLVAEDTLHSITTMSGLLGRNHIRLSANYEIFPENNLDTISANVRRYVDKDVELDFSLDHRTDPRLTSGRAQVNWRAGWAHISPGISYNSDNDLALTLNTRFGLAKDPHNGEIRMFDRSITSNGGISAFVFLDHNGDNEFNDGDEALPDVIVRAPQNSGREVTDENGYAFFNRLINMRMTDVFVDTESLKDPFWIPAYDGAAILPREGHATALQFPIHLSGEMDGTIYARTADGTVRPLRGIVVALYSAEGKQVMRTVSESDGFYLMSKIPPGQYFLNIDSDIQGNFSMPAPQPVTIGYDGTIIYANNIYLDEGRAGVPYSILASAASISPDPSRLEGKSFVLNLGSYGSRVMMGLAWYKIKTLYGGILAGTDLLEKPSQSFVDEEGQHVLRVIVRSNSMADAEKRCRSLSARGQSCTVEILPGGLPQQVAVPSDNTQG